MKTSMACTGMLFNEKDGFKLSKTEKTTTRTLITCTINPGLVELFLSPNQYVVDQKYERKCSRRVVLYISFNIEIWILLTFH